MANPATARIDQDQPKSSYCRPRFHPLQRFGGAGELLCRGRADTSQRSGTTNAAVGRMTDNLCGRDRCQGTCTHETARGVRLDRGYQFQRMRRQDMSVHRNGTARRSHRLSAGIYGWCIDGNVLLVAGLAGMQQRTPRLCCGTWRSWSAFRPNRSGQESGCLRNAECSSRRYFWEIYCHDRCHLAQQLRLDPATRFDGGSKRSLYSRSRTKHRGYDWRLGGVSASWPPSPAELTQQRYQAGATPHLGFHRLELASFLAHLSTSCFDAVAT
jgi:hypothetical protein